jgi:hypothetical protein
MAVFNLRLGVWLPNPRFHPSPLTAARLREGVTPEAPLAPLPAKRKDNPGGWYVFREAFGMNDVKRRKFVYVTDGGHWENIGLVELLRRGCTRVIVLDGSGGRNDWFDTMSEAIALARADLGVEVDIDLGPLKADKKTKRSAAAYAVGRLKFPDGTKGVIVYVRSVVPKDAPPEIAAYAASHPKFPNHPLPDQFFGDATFEAYRSLGKHLVERVTRAGWFGGDPGDAAHWRFPKRTERT